jgi:hypothetical protein
MAFGHRHDRRPGRDHADADARSRHGCALFARKETQQQHRAKKFAAVSVIGVL